MKALPVLAAVTLLHGIAAAGKTTTAPAVSAGQWVVLTVPALRSAIEPLCEARRKEGFRVIVVETTDVSTSDTLKAGRGEELAARIRAICGSQQESSYVLLVGSYVLSGDNEGWRGYLPPLRGTIARTKGEPTDNGYGLPADDGVPVVAVGRLPAGTPEETRGMVAKTLADQGQGRPGFWKRRMTVLAGAPSYNLVVDALVDKLAMSYFAEIPPCWYGRAIYQNAASPFCFPADRLREQATRYLNEGQGLIVYAGHSAADGFWGTFAREDWAALRMGNRGGVFVTTGCHGCEIAGRSDEGYGITAMRNPQGPAAVVGANGVSDAAMSMLVAEGALRHLPDTRESNRLGDYWLAVKKHLSRGTINPAVYYALDHVDGDPAIPLPIKRKEHLERYVLLGDPAMRFPSMPAHIEMKVRGRLLPGEELGITASVGSDLQEATGRLTLERTLGSEATDLARMPKDADGEQLAGVMQANHFKANRFIVAETPIRVSRNELAAMIRVPPSIAWPRLIVRLYLATDSTDGMAVEVLAIPPN